jgi:hypothetical protein
MLFSCLGHWALWLLSRRSKHKTPWERLIQPPRAKTTEGPREGVDEERTARQRNDERDAEADASEQKEQSH